MGRSLPMATQTELNERAQSFSEKLLLSPNTSTAEEIVKSIKNLNYTSDERERLLSLISIKEDNRDYLALVNHMRALLRG